ncbi:MAG: tRNA (adenosine(37)-N6)-dimethylallyltransferase MiaA [Thermodesulfobacteriota bacterium]
MEYQPQSNAVVCIVGPTGTGKTDLALALARRFAVCIINADSRQVYRDFPVVTAQPGPQEQQQCPHALYGFLPTTKKIDAGSFVDLARESIAQAQSNGRLAVLVGGTGLYVRALLKGLAPIPEIPDEIRNRVQRLFHTRNRQWAHRLLQRLDPQWAKHVHPNDRQRVGRGLEVRLATGRSLSQWHARQQEQGCRYNSLLLGVSTDLATLTPRLDKRIQQMLAAGAVEEVQRAWQRCPDSEAPGWTGIGCAELLGYIRGQYSKTVALDMWRKNTRAYAKRQLTWFRKEPEVSWLQPGAEDRVCALVQNWIQAG